MVFGTPGTDKSIVQGCTQFFLGHRRRQQIVPGHLTAPGKHIYDGQLEHLLTGNRYLSGKSGSTAPVDQW